MSWRPIGSACNPDVKRRGRAGRSASGLAKVVPRAAATTVGGKFGWERSGQGDFVKLRHSTKCAILIHCATVVLALQLHIAPIPLSRATFCRCLQDIPLNVPS